MRRLSVYIKIFVTLLVVFAFYIPTSVRGTDNVLKAIPRELPKVGSYEKLVSLLQEADIENDFRTVKKTAAEANATASLSEGENDYSKTNLQVDGVDEGDIVKTYGNYIYTVRGNRVLIIKAYPAENMKIQKTIVFSDEEFNPSELYADNRYLIVTGSVYRQMPAWSVPSTKNKFFCPPLFQTSRTRVYIYDILSKDNIKEVRSLDIDGGYVSSRKIENSFYLITNRRVYRNYIDYGCKILPDYSDSVLGNGTIDIGYDSIRYIPESIEPNYMVIAGLNLDKMDEKLDITAYLGAGQRIYASQENLYTAVTGSKPVKYEGKNDSADTMESSYYTPHTQIYKFRLNKGEARYAGSGDVPGTIINQFSMDEYNKCFRIATTSGRGASANNLYVLDEGMNTIGKLEGLAEGERIYSVRFMGEKAYMVTFKTVDPLFAISLKNPKKPEVIGELKIPGYSDYIQPYDESHIIGFGKDAVEVETRDYFGNVTNKMAYYLGMKIAMFDVSDMKRPREMFAVKIGDRGTDSEVLRNHKALLFSKDRSLMVLPITLYESENKSINKNTVPEYGSFKFQGAYIYKADLENGFTLRGTITHMDTNSSEKPGVYSGFDYNRCISRILYINNTLYTISDDIIMAHDINSLDFISKLEMNN